MGDQNIIDISKGKKLMKFLLVVPLICFTLFGCIDSCENMESDIEESYTSGKIEVLDCLSGLSGRASVAYALEQCN